MAGKQDDGRMSVEVTESDGKAMKRRRVLVKAMKAWELW